MGHQQEAEPLEHFGEWLRRQRRDKLDLTQVQLAIRVSCDRSVIGKIERGERRCPRETCERLMTELGVPVSDQDAYIAWARRVAPPPASLNIGIPSGDQSHLAAQVAEHLLAPGTALIRPGELKEFILVEVGPGGPDVSCRGEACNGKDPGETGCSDKAGIADHVEITDTGGQVIGWVQLRWSELCETNWPRAENSGGRPNLLLRVYLRDAEGDIIPETLQESRAKGIYGKMWYSPTGKIAVCACAVIEGFDEVCTNLI